MSDERRRIGAAGEEMALRHLLKLRMKLLQRNLRLGRLGELDLVMADGKVIVFVEVKSKLSGDGVGGRDNVTIAKQRKLIELGHAYLQRHAASDLPGYSGARFDVVEVLYGDAELSNWKVIHIPDAFRA